MLLLYCDAQNHFFQTFHLPVYSTVQQTPYLSTDGQMPSPFFLITLVLILFIFNCNIIPCPRYRLILNSHLIPQIIIKTLFACSCSIVTSLLQVLTYELSTASCITFFKVSAAFFPTVFLTS